MTATPIPPDAVGSPTPTSRATFRLVIRQGGATNREADTLRHALLARRDADDLADELRALDRADPSGDGGLESRLAVWFAAVDPGTGRLVANDDPVLAGVSAELARWLSELTIG